MFGGNRLLNKFVENFAACRTSLYNAIKKLFGELKKDVGGILDIGIGKSLSV
ncbi:hypothetical protein [Mucilaginibacter sp. UYP25]|uniref:hypothetical protein n=1 Tax=Mucilaginibacter sp. UYP25 TaxID=3156349 RepID=UPI003393F5D8